MANLNHTGAFATVEPIKGDTSEWVHKNNKPFFDQIEKENQREKSDLKKIKETEFKIPEAFKINSVQEVVNTALPTLMEQNRKFQIERDQAKERGDIAGMIRADNKIKNLNRAGDVFKSVLTSIEKEGLDFQKGIDSGKYFATDENLQKLASFSFGDIKIIADDQTGDLMFAFQDLNNDGVIDEKDKQHFTDFVNYKDLYNNPFGEKAIIFDQDKKAREIGTKLGEQVKQRLTASGGKISETKVKEEDVKNFSLNKSELTYLRAVSDIKMNDEELQQAFRDKILSFANNKEEVFGGKGGGSRRGSGGSGNGVNQDKRIIYIEEGIEPAINGPLKEGETIEEKKYHSFGITGYYQLSDKKTGTGKEGIISNIRLYKDDKIILFGEETYKETLNKSNISKTLNDPNTVVKTETRPLKLEGKHDVVNVLADFFGVNSYKEILNELKKIIKENKDYYGAKK